MAKVEEKVVESKTTKTPAKKAEVAKKVSEKKTVRNSTNEKKAVVKNETIVKKNKKTALSGFIL